MKNFFLEKKSTIPHKEITNSLNIYFFGGFIFLIGSFFLNINLLFKIFLFFMYLVGLASDKNIIDSPKIRFILQLTIVILSIIFLENFISSTKIIIIDNFLNNYYFKIFFTALCLMILINGSNFIDGVNLNLVGYYLSISLILVVIGAYENILLPYNFFYLIPWLLLIYILNLGGKIISGDSGAYVISYLFGYILIEFSNNNTNVSPIFIVLLLWYPAFENLFSILRKQKIKKSPLKPDFKHLHQLIYNYFKKKYKIKNNYVNNLTGLIINFYNLSVFFIGLNYYQNSQILTILVTINILIYLKVYFSLSD